MRLFRRVYSNARRINHRSSKLTYSFCYTEERRAKGVNRKRRTKNDREGAREGTTDFTQSKKDKVTRLLPIIQHWWLTSELLKVLCALIVFHIIKTISLYVNWRIKIAERTLMNVENSDRSVARYTRPGLENIFVIKILTRPWTSSVFLKNTHRYSLL